MQILNIGTVKDKKVKLFCGDKYPHLRNAAKELYEDHTIEWWNVEGSFSDLLDWAEYKCYPLTITDLPVLMVCNSANELQVVELYKNFSL